MGGVSAARPRSRRCEARADRALMYNSAMTMMARSMRRALRALPAAALVVALLAAALLAAGPAAATPGETLIVKRDGAAMRAEPDRDAELVARLRQGDRVMEFERRGAWVRAMLFGAVGKEGWIHGGLLAPEPPPPAAEPPPPAPAPEQGGAAEPGTRIVVIEGRDILFLPKRFRRHGFKGHDGKKKHGGSDDAPPPRSRSFTAFPRAGETATSGALVPGISLHR